MQSHRGATYFHQTALNLLMCAKVMHSAYSDLHNCINACRMQRLGHKSS